MSDNKPITGNLRSFLEGALYNSPSCFERATALCDDIDALHKTLENEYDVMRDFNYRVRKATQRNEDVTLFGVNYMALHEDADGMVTHVGDKIDGDDGETVDVIGVSRYGAFYYSDTEQRIKYIHSTDLHHHHEPTVEDVLREFVTEFNRDDSELCDDEIIERFAKRLQLADGDDDE